jgi:hypothetical protein
MLLFAVGSYWNLNECRCFVGFNEMPPGIPKFEPNMNTAFAFIAVSPIVFFTLSIRRSGQAEHHYNGVVTPPFRTLSA